MSKGIVSGHIPESVFSFTIWEETMKKNKIKTIDGLHIELKRDIRKYKTKQ